MEEHPEPVNSAGESPVPVAHTNKRSARKATIAIVILASLVIIFGYCWYKSEEEMTRITTSKNYTSGFSPEGNIYIRRWNINNQPAATLNDDNFDNNYEYATTYDMAGHKIYESYDDNEDGYDEWGRRFTPGGKKVAEYYDLDEDGCHELEIAFDGNLKVEYKDVDFDCEFDSIYVYVNGKLVNTLSDEQFNRFLLPVADSVSAHE